MQTQISDNSPLESNLITKSLNSAQEKIEERAYQQRKNLFDYDEILNKQRNIIYAERRLILESRSVRKDIFAYGEQIIVDLLLELKDKAVPLIENLFGRKFELNSNKKNKYFDFFQNEVALCDFKIYLFNEFWLAYQSKITEFSVRDDKSLETIERNTVLLSTDLIWRDHLQKITLLREAVGWRGYGQQNPLYEYQREAYSMFETREEILRQIVIFDLLRASII